MSKKTTKKTNTTKCAVCGKKFAAKTANSLYCSDACYKKGKAAKDKARKMADKKAPVAVKCKEKVVLGKKLAKAGKPVCERPAKKCDCKEKIDTVFSIKSGNPFKVFVLATLIRNHALGEILKSGKIFKK